jgi:AcrR family transcriptional regulator
LSTTRAVGAPRPASSAIRQSRAERGAATRAALLRSASQSICERGMQGASIDLIVERAGYTKGAFYAHFPSKEELFLAMLEEGFAADLERLETPRRVVRDDGGGVSARTDGDG